jgi:hypothetical protein
MREAWCQTRPKPGIIKIIQKNQEEKYKNRPEENFNRRKLYFKIEKKYKYMKYNTKDKNNKNSSDKKSKRGP